MAFNEINIKKKTKEEISNEKGNTKQSKTLSTDRILGPFFSLITKIQFRRFSKHLRSLLLNIHQANKKRKHTLWTIVSVWTSNVAQN